MITLYNKGRRTTYTQRNQATYYKLVKLGVDEQIAIDADGWADLAVDGENYYCDDNEDIILFCC